MDTLEIFTQEDYENNIAFKGIFIFKGRVLEVRGNSVVHAYDNSVVYAYDDSVVSASGNSVVYASDKSVVYAFDNSVVRAYENSVVFASGNSKILLKNSNIKYKITDNAKFFLLKDEKYDLESFKFLAEKYDENSVILYKSVNPETDCDFRTGQIEYKINEYVEAPDWVADPEIECGNGLHLCLTPQETQFFNKGKILKCKVNLCDISIYKYNMEKVRCKKVFVIEEVTLWN